MQNKKGGELMNKELEYLFERIIKRLDERGDLPITGADLANILEQEVAENRE